jgi:hypothetical protein
MNKTFKEGFRIILLFDFPYWQLHRVILDFFKYITGFGTVIFDFGHLPRAENPLRLTLKIKARRSQWVIYGS